VLFRVWEVTRMDKIFYNYFFKKMSEYETTLKLEETARTVYLMFNNTIDYEKILEIVKQKQDLEEVIDALLEETQEVSKVFELPDTCLSLNESLSVSDFNELNPNSEIKNIEKAVQEKIIQTEETNTKFLVDRIDFLSLKLTEAIESKNLVEEEKKNALKWCVSQVNSAKEALIQKEEIISKQQEEIVLLRKKLEEFSSQSLDNKSILEESKPNFFQSFSDQIDKNIKEIKCELKNKTEEWFTIKKFQDFASQFKKELVEIFRSSPSKLPEQQPPINFAEENHFLIVQKESLDSYIKELEERLKFYEDREILLNQKL